MAKLQQRRQVDADDALQAVGEGGTPIVLDDETNKRLLRIIDWHLMPLMCFVYGLNYLDKTTLSYASIMGLKPGIHLVRDNYQWLGSMFYFGYLAWEYPTTLLLQRLPLAKYSAFCIVMWGVVLTCFATVTNFHGAVAIRFFLGLLESAVTPGFALLTSQWYTRYEQGTRINVWISFNGWGQMIGGFVAYGISVSTRKHHSDIAPWKIVFLATGLVTVAFGLVFWYLVPDNQLNARWLSKQDRILAIERVRVNQQGIGNRNFKPYQAKEALRDPMTWALVFYAVAGDIPNGGISNFFSQLIVGFNYTPEQSLLYGTPGGAYEGVILLLCAFLGGRYKNRILFSLIGLIGSILGMVLIVALPQHLRVGRLIGFYLTQGSVTPFAAQIGIISSNVAGSTKKATVAAMYLIGYCVGNIIGPQVFRPKDAPRYVPGEVTIIVCWGLCVIDIIFIYWYYKRQNAKNADRRAQPGYTKLENQEFLDLTDRENTEFVYTL